MRYIYRLSFLLIIIVIFSCDPLYYINCDDCFTNEPVSCNIELKIGVNSGQDIPFEITIYLGKIEDGIIIDRFYTGYNTSFSALINNEYSVSAVAEINGKTYRVINSTTPETELVENQCESNCFVVKNNSIDLRLKYL